MAVKKSEKKIPTQAVPVSQRMQFYTVALAVISVIVPNILYVVEGLAHSYGGFSISNYLPLFGMQLIFPIIVFAVAFMLSRGYATVLGRLFISVIKSMLALITFSVINTVWTMMTSFLYNSSSYHGSRPPAWMTSPAWTIGLMLVPIIGMVLVDQLTKRSRIQ